MAKLTNQNILDILASGGSVVGSVNGQATLITSADQIPLDLDSFNYIPTTIQDIPTSTTPSNGKTLVYNSTTKKLDWVGINQKVLSNNTTTAIANFTVANNSTLAVTLSYCAEVKNGTDLQTEAGTVTLVAVNKAGTVTIISPAKTSNQISPVGTLSVTFNLTAANPAVLQVNVNSSLSSITSGFPKFNFRVLDNFSNQAYSLV